MDDLHAACDRVLIGTLPEQFRRRIDDALSVGMSRRQIIGLLFPPPWRGQSLVRMAVEAYLDAAQTTGEGR